MTSTAEHSHTQKSCLIASADGVLDRDKGPPKLPELTECRWILPPQSTPTRKAINCIFILTNLTPPTPTVECFDPSVIRALVGRRDLVAILLREIAEDLSASGDLTFFPIETQFAFPDICLIRLRRAQEDSALAHFTAALGHAIRARAS